MCHHRFCRLVCDLTRAGDVGPALGNIPQPVPWRGDFTGGLLEFRHQRDGNHDLSVGTVPFRLRRDLSGLRAYGRSRAGLRADLDSRNQRQNARGTGSGSVTQGNAPPRTRKRNSISKLMKRSFCIQTALRSVGTLALAAAIQSNAFGAAAAAQSPQPCAPTKVQVRNTGARFQLFVNGQPFYIKGAGIEWGSPEKLREHGGNSFRTWSADNPRHTGEWGSPEKLREHGGNSFRTWSADNPRHTGQQV